MPTYTVVGLRPDEGGLLIAGVYEGHLESVCERNLTVGHERWAVTYEADSATAAEVRALLEHDAPALEYVGVTSLEAGDVIVYDDEAIDVLEAEPEIDGDVARLWFESDSVGEYDTSALVRAVSFP